PFHPKAHLVFDHHLSEKMRNKGEHDNYIIEPDAPSAARVVWDYYGGLSTFPKEWEEMMIAVDKGDSADFTRDEVLDSTGWNLLNFLMDARTGLGRFREFRISNYALMMDLIDCCKTQTIDEILALPDVVERVTLYRDHENLFKEQITRCATVYKNL
ncbi:exopolyphosphatase, partial [Vibrio genomosp. F10]